MSNAKVEIFGCLAMRTNSREEEKGKEKKWANVKGIAYCVETSCLQMLDNNTSTEQKMYEKSCE